MHSFNNNAQQQPQQQQQQQAPPNPLYENFIQSQANNLLVAAQTQQQLQHHLQQTQLQNPFAHPSEAQMQQNFEFINNFNAALQQNLAKNSSHKNKAHPYYNKDAKNASIPLATPTPQIPQHLPSLAAAQKFMQAGQFFPPPFMNPNNAAPFDFNQFLLSNMNKNMSAFNSFMQNQKLNPQQHPLNLSQFPHMHPTAFNPPMQQQQHLPTQNQRRQSISAKDSTNATTSKISASKSENDAPKTENFDEENKDENEDEVLDVEVDEEAHEHDDEDEDDDEELEENVSISNSSRYDETYHNSSGLLEDEHRHLSGDSKDDAKAPFNLKYDFTFRTLDFSLYGYLKHDNGLTNFAISGLKIPFHSHDEKQSVNDNKEQKQQALKNSTATTNDGDVPEKKHNKSFSIANLIDSPTQQHEASDSDYQCSTPHNEVNFEKLKFDLPDDLEVRQTTLSDVVHSGLFCKKAVITKGTKFGPYPGKTVYPNDLKLNDDNRHLWEIFVDGRLSHFIDANYHFYDGAPAQHANYWMIFVNCARFAQEQNLIAVQHQGEIYYEVCKDINQGQELLVWYGDSYLQFLGIPVSLKDMTDENNEETIESKDGYTCDRCGKVFAYKYYRDKHLKYTRCVDQGNRKFPCHLCSRSFEKRDRLRIHILHVHEKHRPHKCTVCGKSFSQSSSLNKHMRVHSGERPYKCIYCNKAFTASSILRTHIRQHSGEKPFKCKYCGKAFASHAAHDSHVRRTHFVNKDKDA